ncbi:myozenin-2-like isoform X2 [Nelusetta ayraudi]|uniref:myozenin-2-like isoform X2 n=1 Tax=Nelusetta ayraudi TaxID=303726 RepID=UPI003F72BFED
MMLHTGTDDLTKQRMLQARALSKEARGGGLNLGKKISVPKDVMMEELNLTSNRGSRMFLERQKRAERFTLENIANDVNNTSSVHSEVIHPPQNIPQMQTGKENQAVTIPGYSGPLKNVPCEKFNITVIPKSYCSPWTEALGGIEEDLNIQMPPHQLQQANYRSFNRSAMPFGGAMGSKRVIPTITLEPVEIPKLPSTAQKPMCPRPNFNRAPRGWGIDYNPESNEL